MRIDTHNEIWKAVETHCKEQIELARTALEQVGSPQSETDANRGKIAALREVLNLAKEKPVIESSDNFLPPR